MSPLDRLLIEAECRRLMTRYCRLIDAYDHPALLKLWTPDALWISVNGEMRGIAEIAAYLDRKPRGLSRHLCGNSVIEIEDETRASGSCDFIVHVGEDDPDQPGLRRFRARPIIGRYDDAYRKIDGRWLFAERRTRLLP